VARWRLGSVADKIVREGECPTLVVGPNVKTELAPFQIRRILVPLDGTLVAEGSLPLAVWIARVTGAELDIVRVVSLLVASEGLYDGMGSSPDLLSAIEAAARAYLEGVAGRLQGKATVHTELLLGPAGEQLLGWLADRPSELVVMASHGRSGVVRAALGSVADRMLHGPAPVLILRPDQASGRLVEAARAAAGAS
jgi:nucleotide-binding universal stress UspA family protein